MDYLLTIFTYFGDGSFIVFLGILTFFFKSKKLGLAIIITYIGSGLICASLKQFFAHPRPAYFLIEQPTFHSVPWLSLAYHNAFPSGHTTSAFALATCLTLFCEDKRIGSVTLIVACLTAYSRIYLGQHFWEDVWFGSILGVFFTSVYYIISRQIFLKSRNKIIIAVSNIKLD